MTGIRIEAIKDNRLPRKGPGRAPNDGNFVLSELEVVASPTKDLSHWKEVGNWNFSTTQNLGKWQPESNTKVLDANKSITLSARGKDATLTSSPFYHVGPFIGLGFDQVGGPEKESSFDPNIKFSHGEKILSWKVKPEWKDGQLYGTVFSAENSSNYLLKEIETTAPFTLPVSLGSDDGIKVFLNGREVLANNVGRGASPDQEKLELALKSGKNALLIKIHNGGGPSGFYFKSGVKEAMLPSLSLTQDLPAASYALQLEAYPKTDGVMRVQWGIGKNESQSIRINKKEIWSNHRIDFVAQKAISKLQVFLQKGAKVRSIKILSNGLPTKLLFENALSTFSQRSYPVASAIDGKVAPSANGWAISPQMGKTHFASFQVKSPVRFFGPTDLQITLKQEFQSGQHSLDAFRVAVTDATKPITYGLPEEVKKIFAVESDDRTPQQKQKLVEEFKKSDSRRLKLAKDLAEASKPLPKDPKLSGLENALKTAELPLPLPPEVARLRRARDLSTKQLANKRVIGAQDLAWALINTPSFLFNR